MAVLILAFIAVFRRLKANFNKPEFLAVGFLTILVLLVGTVFYNRVESFSVLDAFYFSVVTLTTIGYGDLVPRTAIGKLFTVIYIFLGVGILTTFITVLAGRKK